MLKFEVLKHAFVPCTTHLLYVPRLPAARVNTVHLCPSYADLSQSKAFSQALWEITTSTEMNILLFVVCNFKSTSCLRNKLTHMYIVFVIACSASGQAYFYSSALQQLQYHRFGTSTFCVASWYLYSYTLHQAKPFIHWYCTLQYMCFSFAAPPWVSSHKDYLKILQICIKKYWKQTLKWLYHNQIFNNNNRFKNE
jgi:hypothetical protein